MAGYGWYNQARNNQRQEQIVIYCQYLRARYFKLLNHVDAACGYYSLCLFLPSYPSCKNMDAKDPPSLSGILKFQFNLMAVWGGVLI